LVAVRCSQGPQFHIHYSDGLNPKPNATDYKGSFFNTYQNLMGRVW